MPRPTGLDNLVECTYNVEDEMVACIIAIYSVVGYHICRLLCHIDTRCAHTTICIVVDRHVYIHINLHTILNKHHHSIVMVPEEHRHSHIHLHSINIPMLIIHRPILCQLTHHLLNNYLRHFNKNLPKKVSNMDS